MEEEEIIFVLELRAAQSLTQAHEAQLLNHLKTNCNRIGLFENFAYRKPEVRRVVA
jgi:GxxExxY protein